ncbi:very-long-chain enoyl-CoA reductase-like isoform X2 [Vanacampus margaritifer]
MDVLALEAKNVNGSEPEKKSSSRPRPKPPKKAKRIVYFEVEILDVKTKEKLLLLDKVEPTATVLDIKALFHKSYPKWYPARQSLRLDPKTKCLRDEEVLQTLPVGTTASFYFSDLGPQLTWGTVFLAECVGPLVIYLMFYFRLPFIYAPKYDFTASKNWVVHSACICHSLHYIKKILETLFVHRISHGTMPLRNIFKAHCDVYLKWINCSKREKTTFECQRLNCRIVGFTGAPQPGWLITSTTRSTRHHFTGSNRRMSDFMFSCFAKSGISPSTSRFVTLNSQVQKSKRFLTRRRIPSRGFFVWCPAQTTHMR